jgi:hypothetical protein
MGKSVDQSYVEFKCYVLMDISCACQSLFADGFDKCV